MGGGAAVGVAGLVTTGAVAVIARRAARIGGFGDRCTITGTQPGIQGRQRAVVNHQNTQVRTLCPGIARHGNIRKPRGEQAYEQQFECFHGCSPDATRLNIGSSQKEVAEYSSRCGRRGFGEIVVRVRGETA